MCMFLFSQRSGVSGIYKFAHFCYFPCAGIGKGFTRSIDNSICCFCWRVCGSWLRWQHQLMPRTKKKCFATFDSLWGDIRFSRNINIASISISAASNTALVSKLRLVGNYIDQMATISICHHHQWGMEEKNGDYFLIDTICLAFIWRVKDG